MTKPMVFRTGQFVWRELITNDVAASVRFYGEALGWKTKTVPMGPGVEYTLLYAGEAQIGGMMKTPMPGVPNFWCSYVSVDDVQKACDRAKAAGGQVVAGPMNAGDIGVMATVIDPQGACLALWRANTGDGERAADARANVGEFCWEELTVPDHDAAKKFYASVVGWETASFGPPGAAMTTFNASANHPVASLMKPQGGAPSSWGTYVVVDDLAAAIARVERGGGKAVTPAIPVPTVGTIAIVTDNIGAYLGLMQPASR
ncbi:MAG: VOC family protein [Polyangiales bacterium]